MKRKLNMLALALTAAFTSGLAASASAQISDNVIRVGLISDFTGAFSDFDGLGGAEAIKMAVADAGGQIAGKKIEFMMFDHQNKADNAANKAREWIDQQGLDVLFGGTNSAANLAMAKIAGDKKKPFFAIGAGTSRLTNEDCTPYTLHWAFDTVSLARGTGSAVTKAGGKTWYFLTLDYAFGKSMESDTSDVVRANGGQILGSVRHPLSASDFSSFLLQAQASKAQILGLATAGTDFINAVKAAKEFGIDKTMKLASLTMFINDVHSLGLNVTQGMYTTTGWYWDLNDDTRAWSKRYFAKMKKQPSMVQAGNYSAAMHYLNAVKATGSDDGDKVMAKMKATKVDDFFARNGVVRPDGRMVHDMYLVEVKKPSESKYPWDYYKVLQTIPGDEVYTTKAESKCSLWK